MPTKDSKDPTRVLRGLLGAAVQNGRTAEAAEYRHELVLANIEKYIRQQMAETWSLTAPEVHRLRRVLESTGGFNFREMGLLDPERGDTVPDTAGDPVRA